MPELPEVETVRRGLESAITGKRIARVILRREGLRIPFPRDLAAVMQGRKIQGVTRRAKYLLIELSGGQTVIIHLGMSGKLLFKTKAPSRYATHDHAVIGFDDGSALVFNDARRFGILTHAKTRHLAKHPYFEHLGPEPFSREFSPAYLARALASRNGPIKPALMDQTLVAGVGNIYASEALYRAGIHPGTPAKTLVREAKTIIRCVREILQAAIESGGSTLRDFVRSSGDAGYFQHHFSVYGRDGEPCARCKRPIQKMTQAARSTYFCASCQKSNAKREVGSSLRAARKAAR